MTMQATEVTLYTVRSGDTLTDIAKKFETTVDQLVHWNHIPDPNRIEVGQKLIVGMWDGPHHTRHTVRRDDTLTEIAAEYGTTVRQLVQWNNIPDPDRIQIGRQLIVATSQPLSAG